MSQIEDLIAEEDALSKLKLEDIEHESILRLKRKGFSDLRMAALLNCAEAEVREKRYEFNVRPVYKRVDTCAAEFSTETAYMYSTYEEECEARPSNRDKILVLGGGPNRIGQGIEFDYCCVHAALAMREDGYETIMVNCNPETVSTDYDTSDRLFFEPVTLEDVLEIVSVEKPKGVIVQFGGQTPLKLAKELEAYGVPIIGTTPDAIDRAEDRERFQKMIEKLDLLQPMNATARTVEEAVELSHGIGYPMVVRPSYVLGGRAMEIVYSESELRHYMKNAVQVSDESPVLLDFFLPNAIEVDVDAICDGKEVTIGGIMQHIEQAGIHSGDSACSLPPYSLSQSVQKEMKNICRKMALELGVRGLMNVQLALQDDKIYVIEVNPRASRTVPFVSKCIGLSLAKVAARCMVGQSLLDQKFVSEITPKHFSVKEAVFPFNKFPGIDPILGPEMKSTGEVMGVGETFGEAYGKAELGANDEIPDGGRAFISVRDRDKNEVGYLAKNLLSLGFELVATKGTAEIIRKEGHSVQVVNKVAEGRPHIVDMIKSDSIDMIINSTEGREAIRDSGTIRSSAEQRGIYCTTTIAGGNAACEALRFKGDIKVRSLQKLHSEIT